MTEDEIRELRQMLLQAGETVNVPTEKLLRWLDDYVDAAADRKRLTDYAARIAAVSFVDIADDHLLPDGSF